MMGLIFRLDLAPSTLFTEDVAVRAKSERSAVIGDDDGDVDLFSGSVVVSF
jgi:hypothetical protein